MAPSLSPNNEWIIFSSNRDGNWELYVASTSSDPASIQRVTYNNIALDTDPMWGPTNYVVFETTRHGNWDLYMVDMTTGLEYRVTDSDGDDINPYWSPDGSRIAFQSNRVDENGESKWQIYEFNLFTRETRLLSDGTSIDVDPQYSNHGANIVYRTYAAEGDNSVIAIMDADGQNRHAITAATEDATNPVWSPDDRLIAYQSNLHGDLDIYIYDVALGSTRQLTENEVDNYAPTWSCSGDRVIFTSDNAGNPDIYEAEVQPISAPPITLEEDADQQTFELSDDIYPESGPVEENASREGQTVLGTFGEQTSFLNPETNLTPEDLSIDGVQREEWSETNSCPV
jgi:Tol biopolymer transport system component